MLGRFQPQVATSRDGRCATSSTTGCAAPVVEEGAQRLSRDHATRRWDQAATSTVSPRLATVAARPPRRPNGRVRRTSPTGGRGRRAAPVTRPRNPALGPGQLPAPGPHVSRRSLRDLLDDRTGAYVVPHQSVVEEGAQRLSRDHATRRWDRAATSTVPPRLATVAARPPRRPSARTSYLTYRWSRKARSACHETSQPGAGTWARPSPGSPRLVTVAARPPRRPSAPGGRGRRAAPVTRPRNPVLGRARGPAPGRRVSW